MLQLAPKSKIQVEGEDNILLDLLMLETMRVLRSSMDCLSEEELEWDDCWNHFLRFQSEFWIDNLEEINI